jgi:hypothetical protein
MVVVGPVNDWQKEKQLKAFNEKKENRTVKVIRGGAEKVINVKLSVWFARVISARNADSSSLPLYS